MMILTQIAKLCFRPLAVLDSSVPVFIVKLMQKMDLAAIKISLGLR